MNPSAWIVWPGLFAVRRPFPAAVALLFLAVFCAAAFPKLHYDDYVQRGFDSDSVHTQNLAALNRALGGRATDIPVLVEFDGQLTDQVLEALRQSVIELQLLDNVTAVQSLFNAYFPADPDGSPGEPVVPDTADAGTAGERIARFETLDTGLPPLLGRDGNSTLLVVSLERDGDGEAIRQVLAGLDEIVSRYFVPGMRARAAGEDVISLEIADSIRSELIVLNAIGSVLAFAAAFAIFSSWRTTLIVFLPASLSAQASLLLFWLLGYPVTVLNVIVPILVLVIALADSVHLTMHHLRAKEQAGQPAAIAGTVCVIGPANAVTSLTTAICFGAVAVTGFAQLDEIAVLGSLSILAAYGIVLTGFAVLARFVHTDASARAWPAGTTRLAERIMALPFTFPRALLAVAVAVAILGAAAGLNIRPWFTLAGNLPADSEVLETHERIEALHGGYLRLWAEIRLDRPLRPQSEQGSQTDWQRVVAVADAAERAAPEYAVISLAALSGASGTREHPPPAGFWNEIPQAMRTDLLSADGYTARTIVLVPEPMRDAATLAAHDRIETALLQAGASRVAGFPQILRHDSIRVIGDLFKGTLIALALASLAIAVFFRWPASALPLFIPNLLPLLATVAGIYGFNAGRIDSSAVLALTVGFGIAVDDSIHLTSAYLRARVTAKEGSDAVREALHSTAPALAATTALITVGLVASLFSDFATVAMFGSVMMATLITALVADVLVLPAILVLWGKANR